MITVAEHQERMLLKKRAVKRGILAGILGTCVLVGILAVCTIFGTFAVTAMTWAHAEESRPQVDRATVDLMTDWKCVKVRDAYDKHPIYKDRTLDWCEVYRAADLDMGVVCYRRADITFSCEYVPGASIRKH